MKNKLLSGLLNGLASLPLPVLYLFADIITPVLYHIVKYRRKVVRANLTSAFPEKTIGNIKKIERKFYKYLGDQIVETLKLLHISDSELRKRVKVTGAEIVNSTLDQGKNAVLLMGHYCNWEWVQEIVHYFNPDSYMVSIYHPLSNKFWDNLFIHMRSRWGAHIVPMRTAPRVLLNKGNMPWVCGFIADAYTAMKKDDNWVNFLNHKTWFIPGPEEIGGKVGADFFYLEMTRLKRGHYEIRLSRLQAEETELPYPYTREFWKEFEKTIEKAPAYWLWSHKRWK